MYELVDNCAMRLLQEPSSYDVLLAPNMFGDILSDEISIFAGSLGMFPSASLNQKGFGMYEPSGGSAPNIAGKNIANPVGQILSAAMMLKYSFGLDAEHDAIVRAVNQTLEKGVKTADITDGLSVGCSGGSAGIRDKFGD
ncbi:MAG: 3-isopropylmalate dehydrogenase [Chlamydiales bacterium]